MQELEAQQWARILIVDDDESIVGLLQRLLERAGYRNLRGVTDPREVLDLIAEWPPDLIVLDLMMPHLDGFALMEELSKRVPDGEYLPILVLSAMTSQESRQRALSMGARDYLTKPFDAMEALLRIRNLLETRALFRRLESRDREIEERVRERTREMAERLATAERVAEHRKSLLERLRRPRTEPVQPTVEPQPAGREAP
jgi:putative two-component system response regulator